MHLRHHGLTPPIAANNHEAATVGLRRHHDSPAVFRVENAGASEEAHVEWNRPDSRTTGAWNNATDATEMGACACCLAAVEFSRERFAVRRAETGTGADYYIGPAGSGVDDLED